MKNLRSIIAFIILISITPSFIYCQEQRRIKESFWQSVQNGQFEEIYKSQDDLYEQLKPDTTFKKIAILSVLQYSNNLFADHNKVLVYEEEVYQGILKHKGKYSAEMGNHLSRLTKTYNELGELEKVISTEKTILEIYEVTFGKESYKYTQAILNLAISLMEAGNYNQSLEYNDEGLLLAKKLNEESLILQGLITFGTIYFHLNNATESRAYNELALKLISNSPKDYIAQQSIILSNLVGVYLKEGKLKEALLLSYESIELKKEVFGENHIRYFSNYIQLAAINQMNGNHKTAVKLYLEVLDFLDTESLLNTPIGFLALNNIATSYSSLNKNKKAIEYLLKADDVISSFYNENHSIRTKVLSNLAQIYHNLNENEVAHMYQLMAQKIQIANYYSLRIGLSEHEQLKYKKELENSLMLSLSLLDSGFENLNYLNGTYKSWLNVNGLLSSDANLLYHRIAVSGDTSLVQLLEELNVAKKKLAISNELTIQEKEKRGIDQQALEEKINSMERTLSKSSQEFADFNRYFYSSDLTNNLNSEELLIDIARIPHYSFYSNEWTDSVKYLVFISDSKDTLVDYLFIDYGESLENEVVSHYTSFASGSNKTSETKDELSYEYFWKPIADKIGDVKTVYISLGGVYNNINLNTLYNTETGKYLLEEKDIRMVNSARDFVLMKERKKKTYAANTAALFGYPNYDGATSAPADSLDYLASTRDLDPIWVESLTRGGMKAALLPATKIEVENISSTFKDNNWQVSSYLDNDASETNIKQLESPRVLHIATHGYFFEDIPDDLSNDRFMGMDRKQVVQNPLLRSGLLFTGANKTLQGDDIKGENGLLSAYESALLNLRATELVVLSACETGRGEIKNSEGVYGLRKAISDAGAANTIMSLWKVDDNVTQEFMSTFYSAWLSGKTIRKAFNETQLAIKAKYPQPYYWGAFILVGE